MTLGENLQRLRRAKGLSQDEVAQKLYLTRQSVSKWENGGAEPGVENLKALARLYVVTIDELVGNAPKDGTQGQEEGSTPEEFYQGILILRFLTAISALFAIRENTLFLNWDLVALAVGCRWRNRQNWIVILALEAASLFVYLIVSVRVFWYGGGNEVLTVLIVSGNILAFVLSLQRKTKKYFCGESRPKE